MRRLKWGVLALFIGAASGCTTYAVAVPSVQGRAYITKDGQTFWNCDATSGTPTCYQTKRKFTPQK